MSLVAVLLMTLTAPRALCETIPIHVHGLGDLLGSTTTTAWTRRTVYQFRGVPYAKSTARHNRFKLPVEAGPWKGVLNATEFRNKCPQANNERELIELQRRIERNEDVEDCLHLNIYTPQVPVDSCRSLMPTMFYIHGGSFRVGSARDFPPDFLLEQDVVFVVIQYRLGPLGFLSFATDEMPGNMGLHDQLMALRWTKRYIPQFCGDPNRITIFGQSSGAAAVTLMLASPLVSPDLFQSVVVQSGSALCDWAIDFSPRAHAETIARMSNCDRSSPHLMIACLRNQSAFHILMAHSDFLTEVLISEGQGVRGNNGGNHAVIERPGPLSYLVEDPRISFQEGRFIKVPMMVGVTKHEGSLFLGNIHDYILERNNVSNNTDSLVHDYLTSTLKFSGIDDTTGAITDVFQDKYFRVEDIGNFTAMFPGLVDICGVTLLKACTLQQARRNALVQPTYLYTFNYKGQFTKFGYSEEDHHYPFPGGVAHSDDLLYLFPTSEAPLNDADSQIAKAVVKLWTSFATTGKPEAPSYIDLSWLPMSSSVGPYLRIDKTSSLKENFFVEYNITMTEGLGTYMQSTSCSSCIIPSSLLLVISIITCRCRVANEYLICLINLYL